MEKGETFKRIPQPLNIVSKQQLKNNGRNDSPYLPWGIQQYHQHHAQPYALNINVSATGPKFKKALLRVFFIHRPQLADSKFSFRGTPA